MMKAVDSAGVLFVSAQLKWVAVCRWPLVLWCY